MIRNIIFDWSGTLVDDLPAVWEATNYVFRQAGLEDLTMERFRAEFCLPFKHFYERFLPNLPLEQLEEWFHGHYAEAERAVGALPHAREFLEFCRARQTRCFVLSSVHQRHYDAQAARTGFDGYFEERYIAVLDKREKIRDLLRDHGLRPEETLFIGDMQHDIDTARHGGVRSCAVLTGYTGAELLRRSEPDLIVEHLGQLKAILAERDWDLPLPVSTLPPPPRPMPIVTVGALIFDPQGRVLMIQTRKWSNLWGIPGGKIEFGESSEDALRREIKEETNLDVASIRFVMAQDCIHSKEFHRDAHFVLLNYTCVAARTEAVQLNDEAEAFRWVSVAEAEAMDLNHPTRLLMERVKGGQ